MTAATVLDSVCGLILIYIFMKIYIVVRNMSEKNEGSTKENASFVG